MSVVLALVLLEGLKSTRCLIPVRFDLLPNALRFTQDIVSLIVVSAEGGAGLLDVYNDEWWWRNTA